MNEDTAHALRDRDEDRVRRETQERADHVRALDEWDTLSADEQERITAQVRQRTTAKYPEAWLRGLCLGELQRRWRERGEVRT